jgi:hypothetical protein
MMGYYAKWVWSSPHITANPQMTLMKSDPQITQMTQIFGIGKTKMAQREDVDEPSGRRPRA